MRVTVTVTSTDDSATRTYTLSLHRKLNGPASNSAGRTAAGCVQTDDHLWRRTRRPRGDALQFCARIVCARTLCLSRRTRWQVRILRHPGQQYLPLLEDRQCPFIHATQPAKLAAGQRHSRMGRRGNKSPISHTVPPAGCRRTVPSIVGVRTPCRNRSGTSRIRQWPWAPPLPCVVDPDSAIVCWTDVRRGHPDTGRRVQGCRRRWIHAHVWHQDRRFPAVLDIWNTVAKGAERSLPGSSGTTAVIAMSRRMRHTEGLLRRPRER